MYSNVSMETEMIQSPSPMEVKTNWKIETPVPVKCLNEVVADGILEQNEYIVKSFEEKGIPKETTLRSLMDFYLPQIDSTVYFHRLFEALVKPKDENYEYGNIERPPYLEIAPKVYNEISVEYHEHLEQCLDAISIELNHFERLGASFESVRIFIDKDDNDEPCFRISTDMTWGNK